MARLEPVHYPALMDAERIVRNFCEAFARQDVEELLEFFSDDAVYENVPIGPALGKDAIRATLNQFLDPKGEARFDIRSLASDGGVVLTERVDHLTLNGKAVSLPVMGAFEVTSDGKISAWRDYFDMAQLTKQLG